MSKYLLSEIIAKTLKSACPAFHSEDGLEPIWQRCKCLAQVDAYCTCVWYLSSSCIAGTWLQLSFVDDEISANERAAKKMLNQAMEACQTII